MLDCRRHHCIPRRRRSTTTSAATTRRASPSTTRPRRAQRRLPRASPTRTSPWRGAPPAGADDGVATFSVEFTKSGRTVTCRADENVLDAAIAAGVRVPSSCSQGMCGTCKLPKLSGEVEMNHNGGIRPREITAGKILGVRRGSRSATSPSTPDRATSSPPTTEAETESPHGRQQSRRLQGPGRGRGRGHRLPQAGTARRGRQQDGNQAGRTARRDPQAGHDQHLRQRPAHGARPHHRAGRPVARATRSPARSSRPATTCSSSRRATSARCRSTSPAAAAGCATRARPASAST